MSDSAENYLRDLVWLIRKELESAAVETDDFSRGRALAFVEVLSLMQAQAAAFGISFDAIGLGEIEPANLLTRARSKVIEHE